MSECKTEQDYLESLLQDKPVPELYPNQPYESVRQHVGFTGMSLGSMLARSRHRAQYGFVYVTQEQSLLLAKILRGKRCVEVGAGTGWLSHLLAKQGIDITASDLGGSAFSGYQMQRVWKRDHEGDSLSLLPGVFDAVILTWPAYDSPFASQVLQAMSIGQLLFYEGESQGGCTADDSFFQALADSKQWRKLPELTSDLNEHHLQFDGIHDHWGVWVKVGTA